MMRIHELLNETFLIELPHIAVGDRAVDLELEIHSNMAPDEFISYINDWIHNKPMQSKTPGLVMRVPPELTKQFVIKLLAHELFEKIITRHYGASIWAQIQHLLRSRLVELNQTKRD